MKMLTVRAETADDPYFSLSTGRYAASAPVATTGGDPV